MADTLDNAYQETIKKVKEEKKLDIKQSPLFREISKNFEHIPIETLEKQMVLKRGDFISAILAIELAIFSKNVPKEYKDLYDAESWSKNYFKYVRKYDEKWRSTYKEFYKSIHKEQELWKKELTS
jgi:hypothetical protein